MTNARHALDERESLLVSALARALFGSALPLFWAFGMHELRGWEYTPPLLDARGDAALGAIVFFAVMFLVWPLVFDRRWAPRVFAPLLSLGCALAIVHAVGLVINFGSDGIGSRLIFGLMIALIPATTALLFFLDARDAWTASRTRFAARPRTAVGIVVALGLLAFGALHATYQVSLRVARDRLGSGSPEAVSATLPPLRLAAQLRGEELVMQDFDRMSGEELSEARSECYRALGFDQYSSD